MKISKIKLKNYNNLNYDEILNLGGRNIDNSLAALGLNSNEPYEITINISTAQQSTSDLAYSLENMGLEENFTYMIALNVRLEIGTAANQEADIYIGGGASINEASLSGCADNNITRAASSRNTSAVVYVIIPPDDRNLAIQVNRGFVGKIIIKMVNIEKIGTNDNDKYYYLQRYIEFVGDSLSYYYPQTTNELNPRAVRDSDGYLLTGIVLDETDTEAIQKVQQDKPGDFAILNTNANAFTYYKLMQGQYINIGVFNKTNNSITWVVPVNGI